MNASLGLDRLLWLIETEVGYIGWCDPSDPMFGYICNSCRLAYGEHVATGYP